MGEMHNRRVEPRDGMIEDALRTLPVAEPPPDLLLGIMAQVHPRPAVDELVFRIGWIDFALSLFFAGMIGMAMLLSYQLPPEIRLQLSLHIRYFKLLNFDWVLWAALGMSALACTAAVVVFSNSQISRSTR